MVPLATLPIGRGGKKKSEQRLHLIINVKMEGKKLRRPGIEPGSTAWKATMLTITPPTL